MVSRTKVFSRFVGGLAGIALSACSGSMMDPVKQVSPGGQPGGTPSVAGPAASGSPTTPVSAGGTPTVTAPAVGGMPGAVPATPVASGSPAPGGQPGTADVPVAPSNVDPATIMGPGCTEDRIVSRTKPCHGHPDPCGLNSGFEGDEFCIRPPPEDKGFQIHFGPKDYANPGDWIMQPNEEFNSSVSSDDVPGDGMAFWDHVTIQMRPGSHHWISMSAPGGTPPQVYRQNDTGCGSGQLFGGGGFGGGQNLIYDNPPNGVPAPENVGIGRAMNRSQNVCLGLHAYNFEDHPRIREAWVNVWTVPADKVTQPTSGIGFVGGTGLRLPPGQKQEVSVMGSASGPGRIIQLYGHRHAWTPRFAVWLNDKLIYDSHDWKESVTFNFDSLTMNPAIDEVHDGAVSGIVDYQAGARLKGTCFVENGSDITLTFQNELEGGEMCNLWGSTVGGGFR
jgi:hypothetical protein